MGGNLKEKNSKRRKKKSKKIEMEGIKQRWKQLEKKKEVKEKEDE